MKMIDDDHFELSTGRRFYANGGCLGMSDSGDQTCHRFPGFNYGGDGGVDCDDWTQAERIEVADYMIAAWQKWRDVKLAPLAAVVQPRLLCANCRESPALANNPFCKKCRDEPISFVGGPADGKPNTEFILNVRDGDVVGVFDFGQNGSFLMMFGETSPYPLRGRYRCVGRELRWEPDGIE